MIWCVLSVDSNLSCRNKKKCFNFIIYYNFSTTFSYSISLTFPSLPAHSPSCRKDCVPTNDDDVPRRRLPGGSDVPAARIRTRTRSRRRCDGGASATIVCPRMHCSPTTKHCTRALTMTTKILIISWKMGAATTTAMMTMRRTKRSLRNRRRLAKAATRTRNWSRLSCAVLQAKLATIRLTIYSCPRSAHVRTLGIGRCRAA